MSFEWFVAARYLSGGRGARRDRFLSAVALIAVGAVAAGVAALVLALSVNAGFRQTFEEQLLGATAHVNLTKKDASGLPDYREMAARLLQIDGVDSVSPALYETVLISSGSRARGIVLKGIEPDNASEHERLFPRMHEGSRDLSRRPGAPEPLLLGHELADELGVFAGDTVLITSPQGRLTPFGLVPRYRNFKVMGIFESGFWDFDAGWAFTHLATTQELFRLGDTVSILELRLADVYSAGEVARRAQELAGAEFVATPWMELHKSLFSALRLEKLVTAMFIGLIVFVAGLNILILLVMLVLEKRRDVAVLLSLGARNRQIERVFVYHGLAIGGLGTVLGLALGYTVALLGGRYHAFPLDPRIYGIAHVPFQPEWLDGVLIALVALVISFVAALYPARRATRVVPVEVLRYE